MADRGHLSIGEVLSLLQEQFPDVTISKIRFLESQGLLDPERTLSGYRKFYEADIDRLRWILRQQRENFLPLKVIKDRLGEHHRTGAPLDETGGAGPGVDGPGERGASRAGAGAERGAGAGATTANSAHRAGAAASAGVRRSASTAASNTAAAAAAAPAPAAAAANPSLFDSGPTSVSLNVDELARASGLHERDVHDLERFGLIGGRIVGRDNLYDDEALVVAKLAAGFLRFGVEARHLRMYKVAAEREAGFFEQVVMPMLKQRNPTARQRALDTLTELATLGDGLRTAMLRNALRGYSTDR